MEAVPDAIGTTMSTYAAARLLCTTLNNIINRATNFWRVFPDASVAFSPDGKKIVSGSRDCTVRVWDTETGKPLSEAINGHSLDVTSVRFSPDGKRIASGSQDYTIRVWHTVAVITAGISAETTPRLDYRKRGRNLIEVSFHQKFKSLCVHRYSRKKQLPFRLSATWTRVGFVADQIYCFGFRVNFTGNFGGRITQW
jgi:WD40 repeat protein